MAPLCFAAHHVHGIGSERRLRCWPKSDDSSDSCSLPQATAKLVFGVSALSSLGEFSENDLLTGQWHTEGSDQESTHVLLYISMQHISGLELLILMPWVNDEIDKTDRHCMTSQSKMLFWALSSSGIVRQSSALLLRQLPVCRVCSGDVPAVRQQARSRPRRSVRKQSRNWFI
jgi:hypothetical protein